MVVAKLSPDQPKTNNGKQLSKRPKPFVKWAGGKSQLVKELIPLLPSKFEAYHEPFLGGGALFFNILPSIAHLSDSNAELINAYLIVQNQCESLLKSLNDHQNTKEYYNLIRECNPQSLDVVTRASRFIYLNKTCYNGLYRVNRSGKFNVPFGSYKKPAFTDAVNLNAASRALQGATIQVSDFSIVLTEAKSGDLVYFDPPYQPISKTAYFTSYTPNAFDENAQVRLAAVFRELDQRGCCLMLSNSDTPLIHQLYQGFRIKQVMAKRFINCNSQGRGAIPEVVVLNY